jgi:exodeoxyribonuclease VII small subunit
MRRADNPAWRLNRGPIVLQVASLFKSFCPTGKLAQGTLPARKLGPQRAVHLTRGRRMRYVSSFSLRRFPSLMPDKNKSDPKSFEAAMAELESIVERMEEGQLPLEESLTAYQRGFALLQYCEKVLGDAQQRIRILEAGELKDLPSDKP